MNTDILKIRQDLIDFHQKTISRKSFDVGGKNYKGWLIYGETPAGAQVQTPTAREVLDVVFFPFSDNVNFVEVQQFRRMYLLCSQDLKDENYQNFKDAIIGSIKNNPDLTTGGADYRQIEIEFDNYWKVNTKPIFDKETEIANTFLTTIETQPTEFKNYLNYTPFPSKERVLTYQLNTTPLTFQKTLIKSLGATLNINSDKLTWNSQKDVSAYISKAKLN